MRLKLGFGTYASGALRRFVGVLRRRGPGLSGIQVAPRAPLPRRALTDADIAAGVHRRQVGGGWDVIGQLQFQYLVQQGLDRDSYLLDVGCGAGRGGVHFARYLAPAHYFGVDSNEHLIRAALSREFPHAGVEDRVPAANFRVTSRFDVDFGVLFDFALAHSVFTHLPLNHLQLCLFRLSQVMREGGRFFVTFFEPEAGQSFDQSGRQVNVVTYPERDPFHYRRIDLEWAASSVADWQFRYIGDWGHPRGQRVGEFRLRSR